MLFRSSVSLCWLGTGFCCSPCVACWGSIPCPVPCSGPRTERDGVVQARVRARNCALAFPPGHMAAAAFAILRSNRGGGLCAPWMWMMCVSMFQSVRLAACVSSCWLRCLRVGIRMYACPCARGMVCDALAPRLASRSVVAAPRCCVASYACIGTVSQGLAKSCISKLSVLPQSEANLSGEAERCKKMVFPAAIREK